jgi:hypothetical protein
MATTRPVFASITTTDPSRPRAACRAAGAHRAGPLDRALQRLLGHALHVAVDRQDERVARDRLGGARRPGDRAGAVDEQLGDAVAAAQGRS